MGPMYNGKLYVYTEDGKVQEFDSVRAIHVEARKPEEPCKEGITIMPCSLDSDYVIVVDHATGNRRYVRYHKDECHSSDFYEAALYALRKRCENKMKSIKPPKERAELEHIELIRYVDEPKTVYAIDKKNGVKTSAKCHPNDCFNIFTGGKLALERMNVQRNNDIIGKALNSWFDHLLNMKVVCTNCDGHNDYLYIPGKVYEIKKGQLIGPNGYLRGLYKSLDDLNDNSDLGQHCHFIEFKGEA